MSWSGSAKEKAYKKAYYLKNRQAILSKMAQDYAANPSAKRERAKYNALAKVFKVKSPLEAKKAYEDLHNKQNGVCALCEKPEFKKDAQLGKTCLLAVDHCHTTGKVRGLLCFICNTNLGRFEKSLDKVLRYLGK